MSNGIEQARKQLSDAGLAFPFIPADLGQRVVALGDWLYGTRAGPSRPYCIDQFVEEACTKRIEDYVLFGSDGHGVNSYAMHYYLVRGRLALFVQVGWGGVYMDPAITKAAVANGFKRAEELAHLVELVRGSESSAPGERLIVVESDFYGGKWARIRPPIARADAAQWRAEDDAMLAVTHWIASRDEI